MNFTVATQVRGREPLWTALSVLATLQGPPGSAPGRKPTHRHRLSPTAQTQATSSRHTGSSSLPGTFEGTHFRDPVARGQSSLCSGPVCHLGLNKPHLPSVRPLGAHLSSVRPLGAHLSQLLPDANPPPVSPGEHVATQPHPAACAYWAAGLGAPLCLPHPPRVQRHPRSIPPSGSHCPQTGTPTKATQGSGSSPEKPRVFGPSSLSLYFGAGKVPALVLV